MQSSFGGDRRPPPASGFGGTFNGMGSCPFCADEVGLLLMLEIVKTAVLP